MYSACVTLGIAHRDPRAAITRVMSEGQLVPAEIVEGSPLRNPRAARGLPAAELSREPSEAARVLRVDGSRDSRAALKQCRRDAILSECRRITRINAVRSPGVSYQKRATLRSEEHTSELQHLGISYAVFCLKKKREETGHDNSEPATCSDGRCWVVEMHADFRHGLSFYRKYCILYTLLDDLAHVAQQYYATFD